MRQETLIFLKTEKDKQLEIPERCEGLFYPLEFKPDEYLKWKNELNPGVRCEFLIQKYQQDSSLYAEVFEAIYKNFITVLDKEYMLYTRFLVDPRNMTGRVDRTAENLHGDADWQPPVIYDEERDSNVRFSGDYSEVYTKFINMLRHCMFGIPATVPKNILEAVKKPGEDFNSGEYSVTLDSINRGSWKILSKWPPLRNLIENMKSKFPDVEKLLEVYGEPDGTCSLDSSFLTRDGEYVDLVDSDSSNIVISSLIEKYGVQNVKFYELQD